MSEDRGSHGSKTLIWVDDKPDNNKVERAHAEAHGVTVVSCESSIQALKALREYSGAIEDLRVATDRHRITRLVEDSGAGPDLVADIRMSQRWRSLPILIYTSSYGVSELQSTGFVAAFDENVFATAARGPCKKFVAFEPLAELVRDDVAVLRGACAGAGATDGGDGK